MANIFPKQQVGVADGTLIPAAKHDGRQIGAAKRVVMASKVAGTAWNVGDTVYLGRKRAGHTLLSFKGCTDTSLGTATVSLGVGSDPRAGVAITDATKYQGAKTLTVTDTPTELGVKASTLDDDPGAEEHLYATIGVAAIAAGTLLTFILEFVGID